jgi:NNP family nitrate/nitrite transporter-like MFS transporter
MFGPDTAAGKALGATVLATAAFALTFAAWVLNAVLVSYLVTSRLFPFGELQVTALLATPFFTGALCRVPLGLACDRFGARRVQIALLAVVIAALLTLSAAQGFASYLGASLAFGLGGGSFAVGLSYVSAFVDPRRRGFALGVFGLGTAGASLTTALAPTVLLLLTKAGAEPEGWRQLPRLYAGVLTLMAVLVVLFGPADAVSRAATASLRQRLAPLGDPVVWRFGGYYAFVFGATVALTQWLLPYGMNVHEMTLQRAGFLATLIALPSGLIKPLGGWLADRFGPGPLMSASFGVCVLVALALSVPRMELRAPGEGVAAQIAGTVTSVTANGIVVAGQPHALQGEPPLASGVQRWHEALVKPGDTVVQRQLLAKGLTRVVYPQPLALVIPLIVLFALACGIGMAGVMSFIPERFPNGVGTVSGLVGLLGGLGGFVLPLLFGFLLHVSGLWASCWWALALLALVCFLGLNVVRRKIVREQAPDLARLLERAAATPLPAVVDTAHQGTLDEVLARIPLFSNLAGEERAALIRVGTRREWPADAIVFAEGDTGNALYVVVRGTVDVRRHGDWVATLGVGEFVGEMAVLDGQPRSATVVALSDIALFELRRADFLAALARSPQLTAHLLLGMSARLRSPVGEEVTA